MAYPQPPPPRRNEPRPRSLISVFIYAIAAAILILVAIAVLGEFFSVTDTMAPTSGGGAAVYTNLVSSSLLALEILAAGILISAIAFGVFHALGLDRGGQEY